MKLKAIFYACCVLLVVQASAQEKSKYLIEGENLVGKGKLKDAIKLYTKAVEEDDHNPVYFQKRGIAYAASMQLNEAYDDFSKAIHLDNNFAEAYLCRAKVLTTVQRFEDAISDLDMAIKYAPNDSVRYEGFLARSGEKMSIRNFKGAFEDSKLFYEYDSLSRDALMNMAMSKLELKEPEVALEYLFRIISLHPKDANALMNIGFVNLQTEHYDTALYYIHKAAELDPKNAYALCNEGYAKLKLGKTREALESVNASLKLNPENSYAYRNRALIFIEMGNTEKACVDLQTAIKKDFTARYGDEVLDLIEKNCRKKK